MEFEDLLKQVGDFGKFQKCLVYFYLMPISVLNSFYDRIFMWATPDHWCRVRQLANFSNEEQQLYIRPKIIEQGLPAHDKCNMYDTDYDLIANLSSIVLNRTDSLTTKRCPNGWVYDRSTFEETAVTRFDLVCDKGYYVNLIMSFGPVGIMIATPILSYITDRIGRKRCFLYITIITFLSFVSPIFLKDIISFSLCFVIGTSLFVNFYQVPYIQVMEFVGTAHRTKVSCLACFAFSMGGCLLPAVAYLTGDWVRLAMVQLCVTLPIFAVWRYLPESASWLITQKRFAETFEVLCRVARVNGQTPPADLMSQIQKISERQDKLKTVKTDSIKDFVKVPELRKRLSIMSFVFVANVLAYGGLALNTLNFHGNEFINYFLLSLADIPATLVSCYLIEGRLGRRWTNAMALMLCGISLCIPVALSESQKTWITGMSLLGKAGTAGSFLIMYQQAAEIFPTTLRSEGLGICSTIGSVAAIGVPYITYLAIYGIWVPMFLMGTICLMASIASTFLPETLNESLPQNSRDSESFGQNKNFFSFASISRDK